ncbi:MAG: HEAT repeat domain-containing protein [Saprospiraceae bacterium]
MNKLFYFFHICIVIVVFSLESCTSNSGTRQEKEPLEIIHQDAASAQKMAAEIKSQSAIKLAAGIQIAVWATDSLAPDPVGMDIDKNNAIYLTRTNRQKNSEFDIRGYPQWMTPSIGFQTVEDRRAFLHKTFAPENSEQNKWLLDLNQDSVHDWHDLAVEKEEVWKLEDLDGDGMAEKSTRIINDFHTEVTDILAGILVRDHDMFLTVGPDVWHMEDTDGDGIMDKKTSISSGYAVHIGFSGHNVSGIIQGPDGKLYWNVGDIGATITDIKGNVYKHPNSGLILRSNPDGSDFEVYAHGLRNTHEFVFDDYGNLISSDNDGDHRGERERLVHVVEGSDAGWRSNWQYGKYTDPKNNRYHVWMDERLSIPRWDGQAAYIIPPIQNFHNGPTGMVFNPGTALGKEWLKKFFLVEFVGNPASSHIWAFDLKPNGASFELKSDLDLVSGILPTGIRFGTDGSLYAADWVNGWNTKNYGRVWKIDVTTDKNDLKNERAETARLFKEDFEKMTESQLADQLKYADMRIRMKAQFELAARGKKGGATFRQVIAQKENQLARIHGIWGLGQLINKGEKYGVDLIGLLNDGDEEIIAQSIKVLGDNRIKEAAGDIQKKLMSKNPRVQFFACQAIGRLEHQSAFDDLLKVIETNADHDVYIRHAANLALSRLGNENKLAALSSSNSKSLRIAAVLALRRLKSPTIKTFLNDSDEYIVTEAARAINDDESITDALPALAHMVNQSKFSNEPLMRRAINACLRVGSGKELNDLLAYAQRNDVSNILKAEAMATIGTWSEPSLTDRVDGRYRGEIKRNADEVKNKIASTLPSFVTSKSPEILISTAGMIAALNITEHSNDLVNIFYKNDSADVRVAALNALNDLKYSKLNDLVIKGISDKSRKVRAAALGMVDKTDMDEKGLSTLVKNLIAKGSPQEQQRLMTVLGKMPMAKSEKILSSLIDDFQAKKLPAALSLDLEETVESSKNEALMDKLKTALPAGHVLDEYMVSLQGGNGWAGRRFFNENTTAQCIKCHTIQEVGSNVGPDLSHIGSSLSREQILQAMVEPTARLAPGYGVVTLILKDGSEVYGKLEKESAKELTLITANAEPLRIPVDRIATRKNIPSSMPVMTTKMNKREMRDVVEYLANLK